MGAVLVLRAPPAARAVHDGRARATAASASTGRTASAIVGIYAASVYLASLPGGWIADRWLGLRRAILYGARAHLRSGHLAIALSSVFARRRPFFLGLVLIVIGTGLLKPNISAIVGDLYPEGDARRDAGFSIFYMGINIGAFLAPLDHRGCSASGSAGTGDSAPPASGCSSA